MRGTAGLQRGGRTGAPGRLCDLMSAYVSNCSPRPSVFSHVSPKRHVKREESPTCGHDWIWPSQDGGTPPTILEAMSAVHGDRCPGTPTVYKWHSLCTQGRAAWRRPLSGRLSGPPQTLSGKVPD